MKPHYALRHSKVDFVRKCLAEGWKESEAIAQFLAKSGLYSPETNVADILSAVPRLIKEAKASPAPAPAPEPVCPALCNHRSWEVRAGFNHGTCLECGQALPWIELMKRLVERFERPYRAKTAEEAAADIVKHYGKTIHVLGY